VEIERREFGTHVDLLPKMLGQNKVRLAIHSRFSEMDSALKVTVGDVTVPAVRAIEMDTDFDAQLGQTTVLGEMTGRDAKTVKNDATGQESRVVDEVRTFFLVTPELVTPEVLEAMVARGGQCTRCNSDEQGPAPTDSVESASARTPAATRRR
jgi:Flp pilus assembly secretin CpaC